MRDREIERERDRAREREREVLGSSLTLIGEEMGRG